ncbi:hypothetical protein GIB67_020012 [Kingdonia uniflora]|uniref:Uncharacterized protein n=1 Tax=Kingdonia uniflora TaxID=39325 RepID=A0A7J7MIB6_9MAGN|nr:hypothetical protein GIB67_020012 [Kingdonia uniflora]
MTTGNEPLVHVPNGEDTVEGEAFGSTGEEILVTESIATCKPKRNVGKLEWLTKVKAMVAYALPIVEEFVVQDKFLIDGKRGNESHSDSSVNSGSNGEGDEDSDSDSKLDLGFGSGSTCNNSVSEEYIST